VLVSKDVGLGVVEHRRVHRRDALEDGDAVALDDLERLAGVEARDQREQAAGVERRVQAARLPERVEQGQRAEGDGVRAEPEQLDHRLRVAAQVVVRELGALRGARRAARVEDDGGVAAVALGHLADGLGLARSPSNSPG
jgi:hypothetical protein